MNKYLISFLVFACLSIEVFAQTKSVSVIENGEINREIALSESSSNLSIEQRLISHYSDSGFFDVEISKRLNEMFRIKTGERYRIKSLVFELEEGSVSIGKELSDKLYSSRLIEERLKKRYQDLINQGYFESNLYIKNIETDSLSKTVSIVAIQKKGNQTKVEDVIFNGNSINSQQYLARISGIQDSMIASESNLNQMRRNLSSSELLEDVSSPEIYKQDDKFVVFFSVQERNLNQLDGLIGFVPDANGKGQVVGDLDISLWNVLREGNAFDLYYQRLKPETSRLELGVSQHWIVNIPLSIGLDFSFYQNDTTYQTRNIGLYSSYLVNSNFKLNGRIYSTISNSSRETGLQQEPDGSKQGSDLGFTYSSLDRIEVPQKGLKIDLIYGIASKDIENDSSIAFRQQRLETRINTYIPVFRNSVIATSINGFYVLGDEFTESDLIRFGGANSFRGYAEEQFTASELLWGDVEYRFLTDQNSYLFLFTAAGIYKRPQLYSEPTNSFTQNDFLYSGGFGISYKIAIGRLKFSYALSSTETLGNGKVHFGISTSL